MCHLEGGGDGGVFCCGCLVTGYHVVPLGEELPGEDR